MAESRKRLSLARAPAQPPRPSMALVKKALRLFSSPLIDKATRHRNARAWLRANAVLGDKHLLQGRVSKGNILKGSTATWGQPGEPGIEQVFAPRRYGVK